MNHLEEMLGQLENMILGTKPFDPLPADAQAAWKEFCKELSNLDPRDLDSVFVNILAKSERSEWCEQCQETHQDDGVRQIVFMAGNPDIIKMATEHGIRGSLERAAAHRRGESGAKNNQSVSDIFKNEGEMLVMREEPTSPTEH